MKMTQELKDRWAAALRSGEYEQTKGQLRRTIPGLADDMTTVPSGYCCLGVLCDILGVFGEDEETALYCGPDGYQESSRHMVPYSLGHELGLREELDSVEYHNVQDLLAHQNDIGKSFIEIADLIEEKVQVNG